MKLFPLLSLLFLLALGSCTSLRVEKRHYRSGFYIAGNSLHSQQEVVLREKTAIESAHDVIADPESLHETITAVSGSVNEAHPKFSRTSTEEKFIVTETVHDTIPPGNNKPADETELDRHIETTQILGTSAIILVILGIIGLEASVYLFPLLLIGIFCAIFGLRIGRLALQATKFTGKHSKDKPHPKRKKAKNAYWLNLAAIMILMLYVLIRVATFGGGAIGFAIVLACIALAFFLLFKMGTFTDLED